MGFLKYLFSSKSSRKSSLSTSSPTTQSTPSTKKTKTGRTFGSGENVDTWAFRKKTKGEWLSKEAYEKKTGKPGRKS